MDTKTFPIRVLLSAQTGRLFCDFGDMHECIEHLLGRSVWTHELASNDLCRQITEAAYDACPALVAEGSVNVRASKFGVWLNQTHREITKDNWSEIVEDFLVAHPEVPLQVSIRRGSTERTKSPLETLAEVAPNANVIVVEVK